MSSAEESDGEVLPGFAEVVRWTKAEMVLWLQRHHLPKSGRNKEVLARRIVRHMVGEESSDEEDEDIEEVCHPKIPLCPGKDDKQWVDLTQPTQLPNLREEDVINYFLHGKNPVTGGRKNCRRYLDKSRRYSLESSFIGKLGICEVDDYYIVKCHVRPSMRQGLYYCTIYLFKDTGMVVSAKCECKVGATGLCSHVGGVLLRLVRLRNPCTSALCGWGVPTASLRKSTEPKKLYDINWWPGKSDPKKPWPFQYKASPCEEDCSQGFLEDILDGLGTANPTCTLYVHKRRTHYDINPFLDSFLASCVLDDSVDLRDEWVMDLFTDFVEDLHVPVELSQNIEKITRGQGCNPLWMQARSVLLTASNFGSIVSRKETTPPENLLKVICGYHSIPKTKAMEYGTRMEAKARKQYMKKHHQSCSATENLVKVQSVGLVVSPKHPFLGASLDGFVYCPKCGKGGLEIKCPWKFRDLQRKCKAFSLKP